MMTQLIGAIKLLEQKISKEQSPVATREDLLNIAHAIARDVEFNRTQELNREQVKFFIWSNERNMWWRPNRCGYTEFKKRAGLYTLAEALEICKEANYAFNYDDMKNAADEVMVPCIL